MRFLTPRYVAIATMLASGVLCTVTASAQGLRALPGEGGGAAGPASRNIVRIDRIRGDKVETPEYKTENVHNTRRATKRWFEINAEYKTAPDWIDELQVQYYVVLKASRPEQGQRSPYTLFSGTTTYVNIEKGIHQAVMYLHPSTIARYGDVERVAVLISVRGQLVAVESEPSSSSRWWEQLTPRQGYLLNRMQTPFAMLNDDSFESIKPTTAGAP